MVFYEIYCRLVQIQRDDFDLLVQQRQQLDRDIQLLGFHERGIWAEARIVSNRQILYSEARRKEPQLHVPKVHGATELFLKLRLNRLAVLVDIESSSKNYSGHDRNKNDNSQCNSDFPHENSFPVAVRKCLMTSDG